MGYQEGGGVSEFEQMLNNAPAGSPDLASISDANAPTKQSGISCYNRLISILALRNIKTGSLPMQVNKDLSVDTKLLQ
jgi:hypothetical protein